MTDCKECKAPLNDDMKYCSKCGTKQSERKSDQEIIEEVFKRQVKRGVIV